MAGGLTIILQETAQPTTGVLPWLADKVLGSLLSGAVLALLGGWWFARINEKYRARRDHYSRTADALKANLDALVAACSKYWTLANPKERATLAPEVSYRFGEVANLAQLCMGTFWKSATDQGPKVLGDLAVECLTRPGEAAVADPARAERIAQLASRLSGLVAEARLAFFEARPTYRPYRLAVVVLLLTLLLL